MIIKKKKDFIQKEIIQETPVLDEVKSEEDVDIFDLDNIEFTQRQERRRGNRRRGYRRIDDRNLISRAQEEAESIKNNAEQEGFKAGLEKAKVDIENFRESLGQFMNAKNEIFEYIAPDILEISIDIARKIIKKEVEQNPQLILDSILSVLKNVSKEEPKITIIVNPAQLATVRENVPAILESIALDAKTNVISDDTIDIGGCIVKSSNGIVDATLQTQLEIIKEAFKGL